jgi:RNA polymerase sigma factor (sigma-70 family)
MSYKLLVVALLRGNQEEIDLHLKELRSGLVGYLQVRMRASEHDAEDAVQQTFLVLLERGSANQLAEIENPGGYIKTILKNEYLKIIRKSAHFSSEPIELYLDSSSEQDQLDILVTKERLEILHDCINKMTAYNRRFIKYCMSHAKIDTNEIANYFSISISNAWSRKFRIIQWLSKCFAKRNNIN